MAGGVKKPLSGLKVLVTRAKHQAGEFSRILRRLGAKPIEFPLIEIKSLKSVRLDRFIQKFCSREINFDYVIFTSRNGVDDFFRRAGGKAKGARTLRAGAVVAIGPGTARALKKRSVPVRAVPEKFIAESVAKMLGAGKVRGKSVLLLRARGARRVLPQMLRKAGADVTVKCLYEALLGSGESRRLRALLREVDFVTVASGSTVRSLVKITGGGRRLAPEQTRKIVGKVKLASIGPVTSRVARKLGLRLDVQAQEYTMQGLADAIVRFIKSEK